MIETKEFTASNGKTYYLHHFPATKGQAIYNRLQSINGDPEKKDALTLLMMPFVSVKTDGDNPSGELKLDSETLINNHVENAKILMDIQQELLHWNFDFLSLGEIYACLNLREKVAPMQSTEMWMDLLRALSIADEQPSENSKRSTRSKTHTTSGKA